MERKKSKTGPVNPSQRPPGKKKKSAAEGAEGVTSGAAGSTGGSREGNAGHVSEQYGSQGNR